MLLWHDDGELPEVSDESETELAERLGPSGLMAIDAALIAATGQTQHKIARIVLRALEAGGHPVSDEYVALHARRFIGLAEAGRVAVFGNPRRPRFSEARLAQARSLH